jgi:macrolide transport system ATP-binding/permease protein
VILVTHDPKVAANAERIIEVSDGEILSDRRNQRDTGQLSDEEEVPPKPPATRRLVASLGLFKEAFNMAWVALISHRMRTLLTMLGIVIGITSVVSISAIGEGAKSATCSRTFRRSAATPSISIPAAVSATSAPRRSRHWCRPTSPR